MAKHDGKIKYFRGVVIRPDDRIPVPFDLGEKGKPLMWEEWRQECRTYLGYEVKPPNRFGQGAQAMSRQELARMGFLFAAGMQFVKSREY